MKHGWAALAFVLALIAFLPVDASAQQQGPGGERRGVAVELGQNYPNPFNPETKIPFAVTGSSCSEVSRLHRVTLRIYNILSQLVAIPILQGEGAPPSLAGERLENLMLPCGRYTAYWDGRNQHTAREVASGIYVYVIEVDGATFAKKMFVSK